MAEDFAADFYREGAELCVGVGGFSWEGAVFVFFVVGVGVVVGPRVGRAGVVAVVFVVILFRERDIGLALELGIVSIGAHA